MAKNSCIEHIELAKSLFDSLENQNPALNESILQVLSFCSTDYLPEEDIFFFTDMLLGSKAMYVSQHYALFCVLDIPKEYLRLFAPQLAHLTPSICGTYDSESLAALDESTQEISQGLLYTALLKILTNTDNTKNYQEILIPVLLNFYITSLQNKDLSDLTVLINAIDTREKFASIYLEEQAVKHLLNLLNLWEIESNNFLAIVYLLANSSHHDVIIRDICIKNRIYHQILVFWSNHKDILQDDEQHYLLIISLNKFLTQDWRSTACAEDTFNLMCELLSTLPLITQTELGFPYFRKALRKNSPAIQHKRKELFQFMGEWLETECIQEQRDILKLIAIHLKAR